MDQSVPIRGSSGHKARLLHDRIILNRIEETQTVKGGIILPGIAEEQQGGGMGDMYLAAGLNRGARAPESEDVSRYTLSLKRGR
jgi:co-chaperonin GroES (HSP10)